jgi:alpha-N-arabinofuranosidase
MNRPSASCLALLSAASVALAAPIVTLTIQADQPGVKISPTLWGIFFEDINYGADGGLYPERVKNGSFEFPDPLMGWRVMPMDESATGAATVVAEAASGRNNRHFLRLRVEEGRPLALANEGFFGLGLEQDAEYTFSVQARSPDARPPSLTFRIALSNQPPAGVGAISGFQREWNRFDRSVRARASVTAARLQLIVAGHGTLDLDLVSLLPNKTFKGHGLRADMAQMLADLKPGFLRFPGGCIVEGRYLTNRYQWKTTIGPRAERQLIINRWNDEFKHRPAPDYFQSFGLGFFEYFQLCEDLGAEPLPILNCGMACQFNSGELVPLDQLEPYIQDALDLIEFANGPASSRWGSQRAAMGHRRPFHLKYLGIGNEQWHQPYLERYAAFAQVLKAKHPEITLIASAGPSPDDERFHFAWPKLRELQADIVDEHCYARPDWFLNSAGRYDRYDRNGPKVFMGEYAAQSDKTVSVKNRNNWECALAEAAFMTGLERNADVVVMSSYAPLFGHEEGWQWRPNLIWCDNLRSYGTPSYYVQQLFSLNRGDRVLPVQLGGTLPNDRGNSRFYATAARDDKAREIIVKAVNASALPVETEIKLQGVNRLGRKGTLTVLAGNLADENSLDAPRRIAPATTSFSAPASRFVHTFRPHSLTVLRLPVAR